MKAINFSRLKKRGLPGDTSKNVLHKIRHYCEKNPSRGKFPLKVRMCKVYIKLIYLLFFKGVDLHDDEINLKDPSDTYMSPETEDNRFSEPLTSLFNPESIKFREDKI